jgi:hypothetical protein
VGPLKPFFPLTSDFFGLTSSYKSVVLEEAFVCIQNLNIGYNDAMMMPTYERRYFINLLIKQNERKMEFMENEKTNQTSTSKGNRQSKISGDSLKNKMKNGDIPLN